MKKNHYISSLSNVCVWLDLLRCAISYYYHVIKHINIRLPEKKVNEYKENSIIFFWISRFDHHHSFISIDQTWWWMIIDDWLVSTMVGAGIELNNRARKKNLKFEIFFLKNKTTIFHQLFYCLWWITFSNVGRQFWFEENEKKKIYIWKNDFIWRLSIFILLNKIHILVP